jgi:3-phenylpropionate/cinnamic acid dioxygenase small subunit
MDLAMIADRIEIADLLTRYATALDTKDWSLWRSVFTANAYIDYRSAGGIDGDREKVAAWLEDAFVLFDMTQHLISNIQCEVDGDTAKVRAMFNNPMHFPGGDKVGLFGGFYNHSLVRTDQGWQSRRLIEETSWAADLKSVALSGP